MKKSFREITTASTLTSGIGTNGNNPTLGQVLTEASTPSEEHAFEDSAYQSHSHGIQSQCSKSSSVTSFAKFPSEESLNFPRRGTSPRPSSALDEKPPSEWYAEYRNQSFQNIGSRMEYVRSRSEYDAHIAEIKGTGYNYNCFFFFF